MNDKDSNIIAKAIVKAVFSLLALFILLWFLYKIRIILIYVIIAFVVSLMGRPLKKMLIKRLKFKDTLATAITLFLIIASFILIFYMFIPMIYEQGKNLSLLDFNAFQLRMQEIIHNLDQVLQQKNITLLQDLSFKEILSKIDLKTIPDLINNIIGIAGNFVAGIFAVSFISFFLLKDSDLATNFMFKFVPDDDIKRYKDLLDNIKNLLSRYFIGLTIQISILFILYTILLNIFDVENATLIALLAALFNLIPYVGQFVAWFLIIGLTLTSSINHISSDNILILIRNISLGFVLIQMWDAFVDQPLIFSKSVKAHPLEIFLVIMITGTLFGVLGMIVAIPFYTMLRLLFKEFYQEYKAHFTIW